MEFFPSLGDGWESGSEMVLQRLWSSVTPLQWTPFPLKLHKVSSTEKESRILLNHKKMQEVSYLIPSCALQTVHHHGAVNHKNTTSYLGMIALGLQVPEMVWQCKRRQNKRHLINQSYESFFSMEMMMTIGQICGLPYIAWLWWVSGSFLNILSSSLSLLNSFSISQLCSHNSSSVGRGTNGFCATYGMTMRQLSSMSSDSISFVEIDDNNSRIKQGACQRRGNSAKIVWCTLVLVRYLCSHSPSASHQATHVAKQLSILYVLYYKTLTLTMLAVTANCQC